MKDNDKRFETINSTQRKNNQFVHSLDGKDIQKTTPIYNKKEYFSDFKNFEIAKSHTIKYSAPTTHIENTDKKFELHKPNTEYLKEDFSKKAVNDVNSHTISTNKTEVNTSAPIEYVPFSIINNKPYDKAETEKSRTTNNHSIVKDNIPDNNSYEVSKPISHTSTINLGCSNKHISNKILNENTSRINESSSTNTDKSFNITRRDLINSSYVNLQDRIDRSISGSIGMINHTIYRTLENGDDENFSNARKIKDGVVVVTSFNATGRTVGRQVGNVNKILSDNSTRLQNFGKYIKGQEKKDFKGYKEFNPYSEKQFSKKIGKFTDLTDRRMSSINREIKELKKIKVNLSSEQQKRLAYLLNYKELKKQHKLFLDDKNTMGGLGFVVKNGVYSIMQQTDNSGMQGLLSTTELASNRYLRTFVSKTTKGTLQLTKSTTKVTGKAIKFVSDKTGLTKEINKTTSKLLETNAAKTTKKTVEAIQHGIHGGVYNAAKKQVILYTPDKFKKVFSSTQKTVQSTAKVINKGVVKPVGKVAKGIKKTYHIASTPFRLIKQASEALKMLFIKLLKWLLIGLAGLIGVGLVMGVVMTLITLILSVFMTDVPNIQEYANYIVELQNNELKEIEDDLADLRDQYDSLNDSRYFYSYKESLSNGKELLSMAAVWNEQEWPEWYNISQNIALKNYIENLFDKSHEFYAVIGERYECAGCKERRVTRTDAKGNKYSYTVVYCSGHRDVDVKVVVMGFDEIFDVDDIGKYPDESRNWAGWTESNREWAKNFYNQDWLELYGLNFAGSAFSPSPISVENKKEIMDKILSQYPDLSEDRINLINTALSVVGRVPYFWGGGHHQNLEPGIDLAWGVEQRVISADGYSSQPLGSYQLYGLDCSGFTRWAILTSTGSDTMYYGAEGQRTHCSSVSQSNLKPGDFANTSDDGHVGIYLYTENGKMYFVHCSPSVDGVGINAPGYFTKFYTPNGISK